MYFITTKRMLEVCFSVHPNIQYRTNISSMDKTSDSLTHPIKSKPESHNNWKRPSRLAILPEQI